MVTSYIVFCLKFWFGKINQQGFYYFIYFISRFPPRILSDFEYCLGTLLRIMKKKPTAMKLKESYEFQI